jgi:translation initiation factor IF-3
LVDAEGGQLGILTLDEAKKLSSEKNLDLMLISKDATPPVCKLIDYGQFMYQQKKKDKKTKKTNNIIKELKMSHKVSIHDYNVRINQATKFLEKKYKVKFTIKFKGREIIYRDQLGIKTIKRVLEDLNEYGIKDNDIVKSGRNLSILINPK